MSKRTTSTSQPSSTPNDSIIANNWDGGPLSKKQWRTLQKAQLPLLHNSFPTMWERAFFFQRATTITVSTEQAFQMSIDNIQIGTFEEPCDPYHLILKDTSKTYDLALEYATRQDELANAASTPASLSSTSSPTPSRAFAKALEDSLKHYTVLPELHDAQDRANFTLIVNTIASAKVREDYQASCAGSARKILLKLRAEDLEADDDLSAHAQRECIRLLSAGLAVADTITFDQLRMDYEFHNKSKTVPDNEQQLCLHYIGAVKALGTRIRDRLEGKLDAAAGADKNMTQTVQIIKKLFVRIETEAAEQAGAAGHALALGRTDPSKSNGAPKAEYTPPTVWIEGKHELCRLCKGQCADSARKHLRRDCTHAPAPSTASAGKGGGAPRDRGGRRGHGRALGAAGDDDGATSGTAEESADERGTDCDSDDLYDETDGVDIDAADVAISSLFQGGAKALNLSTTHEAQDEAEHAEMLQTRTGHANAARGDRRATTPVAPPPASPALTAPPSTPVRTVAEARVLVGALTPDSPLLDIKRLEREIGTGVSMATGGTASRRKIDIVNDMRATLGQQPLEPPMGIPIPSAPAPAAVELLGTAGLGAVTAALATEPLAAPPVTADPAAPPGAATGGAPLRDNRPWQECATGAAIAGPLGAPVRVYELPAAPGRALPALCHTAFDGPETLAAPPPGSLFLGSDPGHFHWLTPPPSPPSALATCLDRRIIFTPIVAAPVAPPVPPPPAEAPRRRRRFCFAPSAGCLGAVLALTVGVILGAALAGDQVAAGVAAIAHHDPGTLTSLLLPAAVLGALAACAIGHVAWGGGTVIPRIIRRLTSSRAPIRQAKPGSNGGVTVAASTTPCIRYPTRRPPPGQKRITAFSRERDLALWLLVRAATGFAPPWIIAFHSMQVITLLIMSVASSITRYRVPTNHRPLDQALASPDSPPRQYPTRSAWLQPWAWHDQLCIHNAFRLFILGTRCRRAITSSITAGARLTADSLPDLTFQLAAAVIHAGASSALRRLSRPRFSLERARSAAATLRAGMRKTALIVILIAVPATVALASTTAADSRSTARHLQTVETVGGTDACLGLLERTLASTKSTPRGRPRRGHVRALSTHRTRNLGSPAWRTALPVRRWSKLVVDSGCTWHVHHTLEELINVRACRDIVEDANGYETECKWVGDLPIIARDRAGREYQILLRGVRHADSFADTLVSVDQLWETARIDTTFRDVRALVFHNNRVDGGNRLELPFSRERGLYRWQVAIARREDTGRCKAAVDKEPSARRGARVQRPTAARPRHDARHNSRGTCGSSRSLKSGIHVAGAQSHVRAMPADDAAALLHRRLHVSLDHLKKLAERSADAPQHIAAARSLTCPHCHEANATRLPHSSTDAYQPTHAGRLVHADIVGPFRRSDSGHYQYAIVLIDDHTRFKFAYFLRRKSDAPSAVRKFISRFNAHANATSTLPVRLVGSLHTDNAGEFLSRKFSELLDENLINLSTCPPHVHQLNGVAERSILSIMSLTRSYLTASNVNMTHWPHAMEMAVDVLNRTSGPVKSGAATPPTSYEMLTGTKPRVMSIMPFGCSAFAVKPRSQYSKTTIDPRAWVGYNLGRSLRSPGAYKIMVPSVGRIVTTSDAYFMEGTFPCRPRGERKDELHDAPTSPPRGDDQPPGVPEVTGSSVAPAAARAENDGDDDRAAWVDANFDPDDENGREFSIADLGHDDESQLGRAGQLAGAASEFDAATGRGVAARSSRRVLILFSGSYRRPDAIATFLAARGLEADVVDNDDKNGGGEKHDLLNDAFFADLYDRVRRGAYLAIFAAPPCSTYSVTRYFPPRDGKAGPPVVRNRWNILGLKDVPGPHRRELRLANEITRRTTILLTAAYRAGTEFALENPADRGDPTKPWIFHFPEHGPIWLDPGMEKLAAACCTETATFAMCMFGAETQKYSTLWFTSGLSPTLRKLNAMLCSHTPGTHESVAGGVQGDSGKWNSADAATYPADFNLFVADSIAALATRDEPRPAPPSQQTPPPTTAPPATPAAEVGDHESPKDPSPPSETTPPAAPVVAPSDDEDAVPPSPSSPSPSKKPRARRRRASEMPIFQRGGGAIGLRPRGDVGHASLAKPAAADPTGFKDALRRDEPGWMASMDKEVTNHANNSSWSYILRAHLPKGRHIVRLIWVYKVKRDGSKKSRLCVQGCSQVAGVDYNQTFCAAMRGASLRLLCALAG